MEVIITQDHGKTLQTKLVEQTDIHTTAVETPNT
jgi:hypothetical protein